MNWREKQNEKWNKSKNAINRVTITVVGFGDRGCKNSLTHST
jgi:hypothetical protein